MTGERGGPIPNLNHRRLFNINNKDITEVDAQNKLEKFRKMNNNYMYPSFNTIAGAGSNGAIVHYRANKFNTKVINKNDIFLCDSGGQYKYGTTDVTRTLCFSKQPNSIKSRMRLLTSLETAACSNPS